MTNEELIKALRWCPKRGCNKCVALLDNGSCKYGGAIKIFEAAADALEAADKRIDGLQKLVDINTKRCEALRKQLREANESYDKRISELEAQLPKEGEWIEDDTTYCGADRANYKCSLCGKICGTWKRGLTQDELPNYCPSCGAKMDGKEQTDE